MGQFNASIEDLERLVVILAHAKDNAPLTEAWQGTADRLYRALSFQVGRYNGK